MLWNHGDCENLKYYIIDQLDIFEIILPIKTPNFKYKYLLTIMQI